MPYLPGRSNCCVSFLALGLTIAVAPIPDTPQILSVPVSSFAREKIGVGNIAVGIASELSVPVGFEGIAEDPEREISVSVTSTNVAGLLDALIQADPRYTWKLAAERIIDICPKNVNQRFLDARIPRFTIANETRAAAVDQLTETQTFQRLLASLHAALRTMISGPPNSHDLGPKITIELNNVFLRTVLNTIVVDSRGSGWSAVRYGNHLQYLSLSIGG